MTCYQKDQLHREIIPLHKINVLTIFSPSQLGKSNLTGLSHLSDKAQKNTEKKKLLLHFLGNLGDGRCLSPQHQHLFNQKFSKQPQNESDALIKDAGCCAFSCFLVAACFDTLCPHQHYKETQYGHRGLNAIK